MGNDHQLQEIPRKKINKIFSNPKGLMWQKLPHADFQGWYGKIYYGKIGFMTFTTVKPFNSDFALVKLIHAVNIGKSLGPVQ
jgi:hypothetical protein